MQASPEERAMMARIRALTALRPGQAFYCDGDVITVKGDDTMPPETEIASKMREEESQKAMKLLRSARNDALAMTDVKILRMFEAGQPVGTEWREYRQTLRDLPSRASPSLDESGRLIGSIPPPPPSL